MSKHDAGCFPGTFGRDIPAAATKAAILGAMGDPELAMLLKQHEAVAAQGPPPSKEFGRQQMLQSLLAIDFSEKDLKKICDVEHLRSIQARTVELLLAAGADPNIVAHNGVSALFMACQRGAVGPARALVAAGP